MLQRHAALLSGLLWIAMLAGCNGDPSGAENTQKESTNTPGLVVTQPAVASQSSTVPEGDETDSKNVDVPPDWLTDVVDDAKRVAGDAKNATTEAANDTAGWIRDLYTNAKETGETTATNTKDWLLEDVSKIGDWEYKTLTMPTDDPAAMELELNRFGQERWDCFWVDQEPTGARFYFKRPRRSYLRHLPAKELLRFVPLLRNDDGGDG